MMGISQKRILKFFNDFREVCEKENLDTISLDNLKVAIELKIGADRLTISKYIQTMGHLRYIEPLPNHLNIYRVNWKRIPKKEAEITIRPDAIFMKKEEAHKK